MRYNIVFLTRNQFGETVHLGDANTDSVTVVDTVVTTHRDAGDEIVVGYVGDRAANYLIYVDDAL